MDRLIKQIQKDFHQIKKRSKVDGVLWRAAYTREDAAVKEYLTELMESKGFQVSQDAVGNLIGTVGGDNEGGTILVGSHLDTVKNGGEYDGLYGVLAGIYAVEALVRKAGRPKKKVQIIGFMEEEGSRFFNGYIGSRALAGTLSEADFLELDKVGISLSEAMKNVGLSPVNWRSAVRRDIEAYYEIHIEQGPVLETSGHQVGLVESINGLVVLRVSVFGRQDHAGTTPMHLRKDALLHASKLIARMDCWAEEVGGSPTVTVGELKVKPGSSNVVPDLVEFSVDIRSDRSQAIQRILARIEDAAKGIRSKGLDVKIERIAEEPPIRLDADLLKENEGICRQMGVSTRAMNSGAGHDAQILAPNIPSALLFVPCVDGRSHAPEEAMTEKAMSDGVEVLSRILYKKAWLESSD